MKEADLTRIDLNLLVVFEALMRARHVGRAAEQLFLSQSATSHALNRLRELLADPLFIRNPRGVEPTPRARELDEPIAAVLASVRAIVRPSAPFDPAQLRRTFRLAAHDLAVLLVLAPIMPELLATAPGVNLRLHPVNTATVIDELDRGHVDLALVAFGNVPKRLQKIPLYKERFVAVARRNHPKLENGRMSLDAFVSLPHALVSWSGDAHGQVDDALEAQGLSRRIALTVTHFLALPFVIGSSDMICVMPCRAAMQMAETAELTLFPLPVKVDPYTSYIVLPQQLAAQPDMAWFCKLLCKPALDLDPLWVGGSDCPAGP
jgi:DNA-binding transcriptional LysR family regulator